MRVAIVHDFLNQRGGAERTVVSLARLFPDAPIFTSLYDPDGTFDDFRELDVRTTFLQKLPHTQAAFRALLPLYPAAFRSIDLSGFDLVISSSTNWAHRVRPSGAFHVVYCYNPPRWLYQSGEYLAEGGPVPAWAMPLIKPMLSWLRRSDRAAATRPDLYIGISKIVAERIRRTYGREAEVIYPPVRTDTFAAAAKQRRGPGEHLLVISRLLPYKRVDLAVQVCTELGLPLVVVGEGPSRPALERVAGRNVRFAGRVGDEELISLLARAKALIHCAQEDFGLVPLEANAAGIPCIAFSNGGASETVIPGKTGILFPAQTGGSLMEALKDLDSVTWSPERLIAHAESFGETAFSERFLRALDTALGGAGR